MKFDIFLNFSGNAREAAEFYAKAFESEVKDLMTFADTPTEGGEAWDPADLDKIMYACVPIFGCNVMFMDMTAEYPLTVGNNIMPTLSTEDKAQMERIFAALSEDGTVDMPLGKTFFSPWYGMVTDKYGIGWSLLWDDGSGM